MQTASDASLYTEGEVCSNAPRVFVEDSIAADFIAAMVEKAEAMSVGDPMASDVDMEALISAPHLEKGLDYVQIGIAKGAELATQPFSRPPTTQNWQAVQPRSPRRTGHRSALASLEVAGGL